MSNESSTSSDGVIDYPFFEGQALDGVWQYSFNANGPSATPMDGYLHYGVTSQIGDNQWVQLSITTSLDTSLGATLTFQVRANTIQGSEVKFTIAGDIILRFTNGGNTVQWQYFNDDNGSFITLANSSICADSKWYTVTMVMSANQISLCENGVFLFSWATSVGSSITPRFDIQVEEERCNLSFDLAEIYSVPSTFAAGVDTPWDYQFSTNLTPLSEAMTFTIPSGAPQVSFADGFVEFAAEPLTQHNKTTSLAVTNSSPAQSIFIYPVRVNASGGDETKIQFPGKNVLRITNNGQSVAWQQYTGNFSTLASSDIVVGATDFTVVTIITSATSVALFENGVYKFKRSYDTTASWNPGLSVQHLDVNTNVSVDIGGIRALPSAKSSTLLGYDLTSDTLAYFPFKGTLENAMGNSNDLTVSSGSMTYTDGKYGLAGDFSNGSTILSIPDLSQATSDSYTLAVWVRIDSLPTSGTLTGIVGNLLLDSNGRLNFNFVYNNQYTFQNQILTSSTTLAADGETWYNVIITYSYDETRLGIYINGALDNLYYLDSDVASSSAIIPCYGTIGGFQAAYNESPVFFQGAISDVMMLAQHVHQPSVNMLANIQSASQTDTAASQAIAVFFVIPLFLAVAGSVLSNYVGYCMIEEAAPEQQSSLDSIVDTIMEMYNANSTVQVTRADCDIPDSMSIGIDIGGEGPLDVQGYLTGIDGAINLNVIDTVEAGGFGDQVGKDIPYIVKLKDPWKTDPAFPFAAAFADRLYMMGCPLTDKDVSEMARIVRAGGEIHLWLDYSVFGTKMEALATLVSSTLETVAELPQFENNGWNEGSDKKEGVWHWMIKVPENYVYG